MDHRPATASTTFFLNVIELLAILAVIAAVWLVYARRDGWAFTVTAVTIASCILPSSWRTRPRHRRLATARTRPDLTGVTTVAGGIKLIPRVALRARSPRDGPCHLL